MNRRSLLASILAILGIGGAAYATSSRRHREIPRNVLQVNTAACLPDGKPGEQLMIVATWKEDTDGNGAWYVFEIGEPFDPKDLAKVGYEPC